MAASAISFDLGAAVMRADIPVRCSQLAAMMRDRGTRLVICDVARVTRPDVVTVEALARLSLTARRHGRRLIISGAGPDLRALVGLLGLAEALFQPADPAEVSPDGGWSG